MGSLRARPDSGKLFFDFRYRGKRCREQTLLDDTPANRKNAQQMLDRIEAEITLDMFDYSKYFPNSSKAAQFQYHQQRLARQNGNNFPLLKDFAEIWFDEMKIQWRKTHIEGVSTSLNKYILPWFGDKEVGYITKAGILEFRSSLAKVKGRKGSSLTASRINHIITPLRMILNEAANRYEFSSPYHGIKSLKIPRVDVEPFTLDEVKLIIDNVRADYRNYYTTRFFTAMRTSEIDGLQWKYVDFERKQILIREAWVREELVYTKNDGSFRTIDMSDIVSDTLKNQHLSTGQYDFVFCNRAGNPLRHNNITKRVWHPLIRRLDLRKRRPYQTRHTAATLWLAAGESPEWIASKRQSDLIYR